MCAARVVERAPLEFIRRQRRRLLPGAAPVAVADEAFLEACKQRKIDLEDPSTWPADRWRVCVLFFDHRDRYISVVYAVLKFVEFWLDVASKMGTVEAIAAALDYIEGTTFHEYAFGQLTGVLPAWHGHWCASCMASVSAGTWTGEKSERCAATAHGRQRVWNISRSWRRNAHPASRGHPMPPSPIPYAPLPLQFYGF